MPDQKLGAMHASGAVIRIADLKLPYYLDKTWWRC